MFSAFASPVTPIGTRIIQYRRYMEPVKLIEYPKGRSINSGPRWTSIRGNAAKARTTALSRCFMFEMSSIKPTIAAMKKTLMAARNGSSATFPRSFCIPTTRDRLTEKAKRAAIPPSSATSGLDDLLTSLPTMPPARIFLMKDGMTMRTSTSERKRPTKTPRPSVSCTDGRATNSCPLAGLIADSSRREAPFSEPISKLPDDSQTRFQEMSPPRSVPRQGFIAAKTSGTQSHVRPNSLHGRNLPGCSNRTGHFDLALGSGPRGSTNRRTVQHRKGRVHRFRGRRWRRLQDPELCGPVPGSDDREPCLRGTSCVLHERRLPTGRESRLENRSNESRGWSLHWRKCDDSVRPDSRTVCDGRGGSGGHEGRSSACSRRRHPGEGRRLGLRMRQAPRC